VTTRSGALLTLVLALAACGGPTPVDRKVQRYLLCEECTEGELDSVLALGNRGEMGLDRALDGPPEDRIENMRLQAESMFDRIPSPAMTRQQYEDHYVENYKALYVSRAALGLRRFNTPTAHAALIDAVRHDNRYREDVRRVLGASAGARLVVLTGDQQHGAVDSFVKVDPTVRVVDSTTGEGLSQVRVAFFVDSGGGKVDSIRLTGSDGRATVRWQLGPSALDSVNVVRAVAAGRTVRLRALGHENGARVVFLVQPSHGKAGQPIKPAIRFVVHDPWGTLDTSLTLSAKVTVVPLKPSSTDSVTLTNGLADLAGFSVQEPGTGLRLKVDVLGAKPAYSDSFDIAP
jgi:hypothetical protein